MLVGVARFAESGTQAVAYVIDLTERNWVEAEARERQRRHREIQLELEHASRIARRTVAAGTASKFGPSFARPVSRPVSRTAGRSKNDRYSDIRLDNIERRSIYNAA